MTDLLERYVHQVGRNLPPKERAEIEAELRSQIQDQLDDRFGASPSQAEVASVLAEFGDPHQLAASYRGEQYLVGPDLYPYMILTLRHAWLLVTPVVVFLNLFGMLISAQQRSLLSLFLETLIAGVQATLIVSAIVVLVFAVIQHSGEEIDTMKEAFNPLELPEVDDPGSVNRVEAASGMTIGALVTLILLYFLRVGGLTLSFNLSDPGEVIPFPVQWMILLIIAIVVQVIIEMVALRRNHWSGGLWLGQTIMETFGVICLYFAVLEPIFERIISDNPTLTNLPLIGSGAEIFTVGFAILTLLSKGTKLVKLWTYGKNSPPPVTAPSDR
jgi:hypothetical protein